jgi:hypothetical protein
MAKAKRQKIQPLAIAITLSLNLQKSGVEIRFPEDPGDEVRDILIENGWRFNPYGAGRIRWQDPTWYKRYTPECLKFARDLVRLLGGMDNTGPVVAALAAAQAAQPTAPAPAQPQPVAPVSPPSPAIPPRLPAIAAAVASEFPAKQELAPTPLQGTVEIKVPALAA